MEVNKVKSKNLIDEKKERTKEKTLLINNSFKEKELLIEKIRNPLLRKALLTYYCHRAKKLPNREGVEEIIKIMDKINENKELVHICKLFPSLIVYEKALTKIEKNARAKHIKRLGLKSWVDLMKIYLNNRKVLHTTANDDLRTKIEHKLKGAINEYVEYEYKCGIINEELRNKRKKEFYKFSLASGSIFIGGILYLAETEGSIIFYGSLLYLLYYLINSIKEKLKKWEEEDKRKKIKISLDTEELNKRKKEFYKFSLASGSILETGAFYGIGIKDYIVFYSFTLYLLYYYTTYYLEKREDLENIKYTISDWLTSPLDEDKIRRISNIL